MENNNSTSKYDSKGRPIKKNKFPKIKFEYFIIGLIMLFILKFTLSLLNVNPIQSNLLYLMIFLVIIYKLYFNSEISLNKTKQTENSELEKMTNFKELNLEQKNENTNNQTNFKEDESEYDEEKADRLIKEANKY